MDYELNRIQYVIMNIMKSQKATDYMHSISCKEIMEIENHSKMTTIYKHIKILEKKGLVIQGAKVERAYAYFLSKSAVEEMRENKED